MIVVDDQSDDETRTVARTAFAGDVRIVRGAHLPDGWTGKLWALEQGCRLVETPLVLLW